MSESLLSQGVKAMEVRCADALDLCGEILATVRVNRERGTLRSDDEAAFDALVARWGERLKALTGAASAATEMRERLAKSEERRDLLQDVGDNLMLLLTKLMEECDAMARRGAFRELSVASRRKIDAIIEEHRAALADKGQ